jgi:hypothetical protein
MSDTKWRKVFSLLDERPDLNQFQWIFKFVGHDGERVGCAIAGLYPPRPWVDSSSFGPIPLRSLEWLLLPRVAEYRWDRTIPTRYEKQDVEEAFNALSVVGRLPLELTERGLFIRGYLPTGD